MHPDLFQLPFFDLTIRTYGVMIVIGFLLAVFIIRRLSRNITPDPDLITSAALYSLIAGVAGARLFHVIHYFDSYKDNLLSVFAIWNGGLELLGGVVLAITVLILYMRFHKLPIRRYLDILAIGLMLALAFGRIGCFFSGCCFGKPTQSVCSVTFPYGSPAFRSQIAKDENRNRFHPYLVLPPEYYNNQGYLKEKNELEVEQTRSLPVHPTQVYSSAYAFIICLILYLFWKKGLKVEKMERSGLKWIGPGSTFGLMFAIYGPTRFLMEFLRDDNPFEIDHLTISQLLGIGLLILGLVLMTIFAKLRPNKIVPIK